MWPHRLGVRTPNFHSGSPGSNPGGATTNQLNLFYNIVQRVYNFCIGLGILGRRAFSGKTGSVRFRI